MTHRRCQVLHAIKQQFTEEQLEHYQRSFRELDVDDSGTVDVDEFSALFKKLGMKMSKREVRTIISEVDVDNSGEIEFNEFLLVMKHLSDGGAKQASQLGRLLAQVRAAHLRFRQITPLITRVFARAGRSNREDAECARWKRRDRRQGPRRQLWLFVQPGPQSLDGR